MARRWITDAVLVSSAPVAAYYYSFMYERGFAEHFGYSEELIQVGFDTFIRMFAAVAIVLFMMWLALDILRLVVPKHPNWKHVWAVLVTVFFVTWLIVYSQFPNWHVAIMVPAAAVIVLTIFVIRAILEIRRHKTAKYSNESDTVSQLPSATKEPEAQPAPPSPANGDSLGGYIKKSVYPIVYTITIGLGTLMSLLGSIQAANLEKFFLAKGYDGTPQNECVVLRVYGDLIVCAEINQPAKQVHRKFILLKLHTDSTKPLRLVPAAFGKLTVVD